MLKTDQHPCYSPDAGHKYARIHLPVAPKCNVSCNYCNRKYDCLNESRPGVTSELTSPEQAEQRYILAKTQVANLTVVGIAGPGDALANWQETKETVERIKKRDPKVIICLSTNGLKLPQYQEEIIQLGIRHITITINCLTPKVGAQLYRWINYRGERYYGEEGVSILIANQLAGLEYLANQGALVKVNIVMVAGINDSQIPALVKKVKDLGAHMTNIMPLIPAPGSVFAQFEPTEQKAVEEMRQECQLELKQMLHCRQCRADAVGMLGCDQSLTPELSCNGEAG